ncbi:MAG: DUF2794 domain-containing protein [Alphaproteobacteria bacterium]|nr:DUF2794 domain-containing protein [Alphaproteobacteria bacterium]
MARKVLRLADYRRKAARPVYFTKNELNRLLSVYSRRVIGGEWKDYAIDFGRGMVAFSIYGTVSGRPLFTVYKFAPGSHRQGDYVLASGGNTLQRGGTLDNVLATFDRKLSLVSR